MYFDIDSHRDCFRTKEDEAYFWHGRTNGVGGQNEAMDIASQNDGKTLERCMLDNRAELEAAGVRFEDNDDGTVNIKYGSNPDESQRFWEDCSKAFAEQSSGNVHVIEGTDPRPNGQSESDYPSVYNRIERPALEENQNVNGITHINPSDGKVTSYEPVVHKNAGQNSEATGTSSQTVASEGGGSHAPPASNNETETTKRGHKPDPTENNEQHKEPIIRGKREQEPVQNNGNEAANTQKRGFTPSNENNDAIKTVDPATEQSSKVAEEASKQAAEQAGRETAKTAALGV